MSRLLSLSKQYTLYGLVFFFTPRRTSNPNSNPACRLSKNKDFLNDVNQTKVRVVVTRSFVDCTNNSQG